MNLTISVLQNWQSQIHAPKEGKDNFTSLLFELEVLFTDTAKLVMDDRHLFGNNNGNSSI